MKNRAKCKLCQCVIESFFNGDYIECECGEIAVYDGPALRASFKNEENFLRLDNEGNEHPIQYKQRDKHEEENKVSVGSHEKPSRNELIAELDNLIKTYDELPVNAAMQPITHADHQSLLMILSSIFKAS